MSDTHSHHHHSHSHEGPHGPHCEDELRRDVEEMREDLGHTVEELASRADVKARARTRLRETRQQAEARRAELRGRVGAKHRVHGRTSSGDGRAEPVPADAGSGAYRADMKEGTSRRKPLMVAGGAAVAACAVGVLMHRSGRSPMGGHSMGGHSMAGRAMGGLHKGGHTMGGRTMGGHHMAGHHMAGHRMARHRMGGHGMGGHGMGGHGTAGHRMGASAVKSLESVRAVHLTHPMGSPKGGSLFGGHSATGGGLPHLRGGHRGAPGGSVLRGMALEKGAAMVGGAPVLGAKVMGQGVRKGGALMQA
ncbi:DUF3618 domain-containing protein, partial [Streptomyces sp. UH6]|uniref:DUF3618 domain-containing protein n=1 Tax=Streptomyces sp. UH6 TaxID=2748379 RepID=UPI0015D509AA